MRFRVRPFTASSFDNGNYLVESPPPTPPVVSFGRPRVPWERIGSTVSPMVHITGRLALLLFGREWKQLRLILSIVLHSPLQSPAVPSVALRGSLRPGLRHLSVCHQGLTRTPGYGQTKKGSPLRPQGDPVSVAAPHPVYVPPIRNTPCLLRHCQQGSLDCVPKLWRSH